MGRYVFSRCRERDYYWWVYSWSIYKLRETENRLRLLEKVLENFKNLVALEKNQKNVTVASSFSLDQDQIERIKAALQKRTGSEINVSAEIDKSLIGGIKISYEDQVIDLSLKNKLEALKAQLRN